MRNLQKDKTLYLGLDGGQSETFAVICDNTGRILGTGRLGRCVSGDELCIYNIAGAVSGALQDASLTPGSAFGGVVFGMSGGFNTVCIGDYVNTRNGRAVWDAETALAGAAGSADPTNSALVIAGTGSVSVGIRPDKSRCRCGGWGYVLGDPGSGYDIGRKLFEAAARDCDGRGAHTALTELLCTRFGVSELLSMKKEMYESDPLLFFSPLAPLCDRACGMGDPVALKIAFDAGFELATLVAGLVSKGGLRSDCSVYRAGGVFNSPYITDAFAENLHKMLPEAVLCENEYPPCLGAILLAAGTDGADTPDFRRALRSEADMRNLKGNFKP